MFRCLHLVFITDIGRLIDGLHDAHSFIMFFYFQTCKCKHSTHFCVQVTSLRRPDHRGSHATHSICTMPIYNSPAIQASYWHLPLFLLTFIITLISDHLTFYLPSIFTQKQAWIHLVSLMQLNSLQVWQGEEFNMSYKGLQCISGKSFETVKGVSSNMPM